METINKDIFSINPKNLTKCIYKDLKTYARVYKVYDGDTVSIIFNYNNEFIKYSCRVNRIDTPEIRTKNQVEKEHALIAKKYLSDMILEKIIIVKILGFDKYGRLLVELYDADNGKNINDLMISGGFANEYYGKTKLDFKF